MSSPSSPPSPSRLAIASAITGAVLLVGTPVVWQLAQPADTVGEVPVSGSFAFAAQDTEDTASLAPSATTDLPDAAAPEQVPTPDPASEPEPELAPEPAPVEQPTSLTIPALGVDAPVIPVGLEPNRSMEIPEDVGTVGWYDLGVMPGETGTAVLSGHVDSRAQGRGAFWDLRELDLDDIVTVDHEDGTTSDWRVTARTVYAKDEVPLGDIFTRYGDTRLVLITCGGAFDNTTRQYEDNVVVYTEPVAPATT